MTKSKPNRSEKIELRVTPGFKAEVKEAAEGAGVTTTRWIETVVKKELKRKRTQVGSEQS
jgi:hypothetical protein